MSNTPAPIFNPRKRPRQSLVTDPQQNIGSFLGPGPSGAAPYQDLMPPGGFGNSQKQVVQGRNTPNSGQGTASYPKQNNGTNQTQLNQSRMNASRFGVSNSNKQSFSSNNSSKPQPTQMRQQNQAFNSHFNQQPFKRQPWNQQSNKPNSTQQAVGGGQPSWSRNSGNSISNKAGYGNNTTNRAGFGQNNNNTNVGFRSNNTATSSHNNNRFGNNNMKISFGNNQSSWNRNGGNQNTNNIQHFGNQNVAQNSQGMNRGGFNAGNNYASSGFGPNSKMVATSSGSSQMNNRQTGSRYFNNSTVNNQGAASQYRFNGPQNQTMGGVSAFGADTDEWDTSFDESTQAMGFGVSNTQTQKKPIAAVPKKSSPQDNGVRVLTVNTNGVRRWSKFKDSFPLLFEMFGVLDSAVTKSSTDCKEFMLCDEERNSLKCVFFEIDRQIPKMTRGMMYRVVGTYDRSKERLKCSSVRSTSDSERVLGAKLASICTQAMIAETRNMREI